MITAILKKSSQFLLILTLSIGWVFSGWPQVFNFPPNIQKAYAATLSYVGGTSCSGTGSTYSCSLTSLTGGSGSSATAGDIVIVITGWASTANGDPGVTTSGYTEVPGSTDLYKSDSRDTNVSADYKVMGASPDTSVTVSGFNNAANGGATVVQVWRGIDPTTPMDATVTTATGGNASSPNSPSITPVTSGAVVLSTGLGTDDTTPLTKTAPTGYSNAVTTTGTGSTMSVTVGIASKAWSSGAEDPAAWTGGETSTSDSWGAFSIALRPASAYNQSAYRFFDNADSTDVGSALAAQDTAATLGSTGAAFRLRMLIHQTEGRTEVSGQSFKLQFAAKSGTCDTGFSGESYADVTGSTVIAYNNNATPADGDNLTANANDPTHSGDTIVNQTYEEANNFTNTVAVIPSGQDGKWDFSLIDNGASASTAYCLRAVKSDGTVLDTYTSIPEVTTAAPVYSISITSSGVVTYGSVQLSTASSTVGNGYTQTAQNDGNTTEKLNVKSSDATGGTTWTLGSSIGSNQYTHEFSTTTGSTWTAMTVADTYVTAAPSVAQSGTVNFDFRLTTPSASSDYQQKSITITIQAVAP